MPNWLVIFHADAFILLMMVIAFERSILVIWIAWQRAGVAIRIRVILRLW